MASREVSRREFIGISAGAAAGAALAGSGMATFLTREAGAVTSFTPYMVKLPVPPVVKPELDAETGVYRLSLWTNQNTTDKMHPKLPKVTVWGYNVAPEGGGYLGPTIEVQRKDASGNPYTTRVDFTNNLPGPHPYIPIAETAPDGTPFPGVDERGTGPRILTHLHGGFVSGDNDGNPYATQDEYAKDETQQVTYPSQPRATTSWYHDHALGMTRLNVYAGLAGFFLIRDENDTGAEPNPIGIPGGAYEIPIVIQDKSFENGQLSYPGEPEEPGEEPHWEPEFFGNTPVVNGAVQPFLEVEPRMYRFRFLNGSQSRFYNLELAIAGGNPKAPRFNQIGSEGGMFEEPVEDLKQILLLPAERADVIVDFRGLDRKDIELKNRSLPAGVVSPAEPKLTSLMQFRVRGPVTEPGGPTSIPDALPGSKPDLPDPDPNFPERKRYITLEEVLDEEGDPVRLEINGRLFDDPADADGVDETPLAGTVEDWTFVNISADTHPIHMHLTHFQVKGRTPLDGVPYAQDLANARALAANKPLPYPARPAPPPLRANNTIDPTSYLLGPEVAPGLNEQGWKETVGANPNQVTRIRQKFDLPEGVSAPQKYVYHCHILEHEDNDMMRPYEVV